jgi:hypothetical protein
LLRLVYNNLRFWDSTVSSARRAVEQSVPNSKKKKEITLREEFSQRVKKSRRREKIEKGVSGKPGTLLL